MDSPQASELESRGSLLSILQGLPVEGARVREEHLGAGEAGLTWPCAGACAATGPGPGWFPDSPTDPLLSRAKILLLTSLLPVAVVYVS